MTSAPTMPRTGEIWVHTKTHRTYEIIGISTSTETGKPEVVYRKFADGDSSRLFNRPLEVFLQSVDLHLGVPNPSRDYRFVLEREQPADYSGVIIR